MGVAHNMIICSLHSVRLLIQGGDIHASRDPGGYLSYSLNSLKGGYIGIYIGTTIGDIRGDTRSLDYGSFVV